MFDSLVEEHDVRFPDLVGRQPQHADAAVVRLVPLQLVVVPHLNKIFLSAQKKYFRPYQVQQEVSLARVAKC